jgi:hypothetical protein
MATESEKQTALVLLHSVQDVLTSAARIAGRAAERLEDTDLHPLFVELRNALDRGLPTVEIQSKISQATRPTKAAKETDSHSFFVELQDAIDKGLRLEDKGVPIAVIRDMIARSAR